MNKKLLLTLIATLLATQPAQASIWSSISRNKNVLSLVAGLVIGGIAYYWYKQKRQLPLEDQSALTVKDESAYYLVGALRLLTDAVENYLLTTGRHLARDRELPYADHYQMVVPDEDDLYRCLSNIDSLIIQVRACDINGENYDKRYASLLSDIARLRAEFAALTH